ncbi:MAG: serine/threonine-protein kinase, partial [Acidimicrobiales bacterium]
MAPNRAAPGHGAVLDGRYELVRQIARGGMSDVYEGRDRLLQRPVAVKVYRAGAPIDRDRFDAEAVTLAALNNPGVVQVYDAGEDGDDLFVVLELVDGPTLRSILDARGALPPAEVAALGTAVADALAFVHASQIVHRDVTPSNILCGRGGRIRLADFGVSRLLGSERVTAPAMAIGTAAYMAPEQVEGRDVTPAADIYALGLLLLEALTGRPAFRGAPHEVALARLTQDPEIGSDVPVSWRSLLRAMTARHPARRPPASTVGDELEALGRAPSPTARVIPTAGNEGDSVIDLRAPTEVVAAAGGTMVMPAAVRPPTPSPDAGAPETAPSRRALWLVVAVVALVAAVVAAQSGDGIEVPSTTTNPPVATDPPTTAPMPTTTDAPERDGPGKGKG